MRSRSRISTAIAAFFWMRAPAGTVDPQLTLSNNDGRITYSGGVRDGDTRTPIPLGDAAGLVLLSENEIEAAAVQLTA